MPKEWTGKLVGLMHCEKISHSELAERLGVTNRYLSMILNGHRNPKGAQEKIETALQQLIAEKGES